MEFKNLEQFKAAVKDYNIHLGKEVRWIKTDKVRARAIWLKKKRAQTTPDKVPLTQTHPQPEDNVSQPYIFYASSQTGNSASVTQPESVMENPLPQPTQIQTAVRRPQYVMENPLPQPTLIQTAVGRPQSIMENPLPQPTQEFYKACNSHKCIKGSSSSVQLRAPAPSIDVVKPPTPLASAVELPLGNATPGTSSLPSQGTPSTEFKFIPTPGQQSRHQKNN
ncbi:hypothetical protein SESBI_04595 [Sesbania bispinosa]|nr:hypothetical protein SESBI_04595 [Sesbania bispinosa]